MAGNRVRSIAGHLQAAPVAAASNGVEQSAPVEAADEQFPLESFPENGVALLPALFTGEPLRNLQRSFRKAQAAERRKWEADLQKPEGERWHNPGYFDIPRAIETDPESYCALLENPRVVQALKATVGDDVQVVAMQARTVPGAAESYALWHRDHAPTPLHATLSNSVKIFLQVFDRASSVDRALTLLFPR